MQRFLREEGAAVALLRPAAGMAKIPLEGDASELTAAEEREANPLRVYDKATGKEENGVHEEHRQPIAFMQDLARGFSTESSVFV